MGKLSALKKMNKSISQLYYMILQHNYRINGDNGLLISRNTGGVFAQRVISDSMMKDFTSVQRYLYPDGWMAEGLWTK